MMETAGASGAQKRDLREGAVPFSLPAQGAALGSPCRLPVEIDRGDGSHKTAAFKRKTEPTGAAGGVARAANSAKSEWNARDETWGRLMRASLAGDQAAYRNLLADVSPFLRAMARRGCARVGFSAVEAEDIVQQTLLALHLKRHTWDPGRNFLPWISVIARNKLIDAIRRRGRRAEVNIEDFGDTLLVASVELDYLENRVALRLLDRLPIEQREAIQSVSICGESFREAAARLSMTEGALRVSIHRGLKNLAALHQKSDQ
jgi:RNA polymerase sigma-70 factor (ECF subfamily)